MTLKVITEFGQELSEDDLKNLRIFLREMVVQSLVPWLERAVVVGNEQVRRRSVLLICAIEIDLDRRPIVCSFETVYRRAAVQRGSEIFWRIRSEKRIAGLFGYCSHRIQCYQGIVSSPLRRI